jgi:hypothetical protein
MVRRSGVGLVLCEGVPEPSSWALPPVPGRAATPSSKDQSHPTLNAVRPGHWLDVAALREGLDHLLVCGPRSPSAAGSGGVTVSRRASRLDDGGEVDQGGSPRHRPEAEADRWVDRPQRAPRSRPARVASAATMTCRSWAPYHWRRRSRVRPRVRTPGRSQRAGRSSRPIHQVARANGAGSACSSRPRRVRPPTVNERCRGPASTVQRAPERRALEGATWTSSKR